MSGSPPAADATPGVIAWLDISADNAPSWPFRPRTGPLGLHIAPIDLARGAFYFKGARLRGSRCLWAATSLAGVALTRSPRTSAAETAPPPLQLLVRGESSGSVFDPKSTFTHGVLKVMDPGAAIEEDFHENSHLYTLNVPPSTAGVEAAGLSEAIGRSFAVTPFQVQLLRSMTPLLLADSHGLGSAVAQVGIDRYLGSCAGLLLRTCVATRDEPDPADSVRSRTESIIFERATEEGLSPGVIAAELSVSLRQLYRAFDGMESPAALIRRRRLERAAELLVSGRAAISVESVARECGFTSAEYFSRAFRREFGLSPRAYRSVHRVSPAP